jgi:hypothetical protein
MGLRIRVFVCSVAVCVCMAGCDCPFAADPLHVEMRSPKDSWELVPGICEPLVLITSPSGIGSAHINFEPGCFPRRFAVGLRYAPGKPFTRLEGFDVTGGTGKWGSGVRIARDDFLRIEIPGAAFDAGNVPLTVSWVDVYR